MIYLVNLSEKDFIRKKNKWWEFNIFSFFSPLTIAETTRFVTAKEMDVSLQNVVCILLWLLVGCCSLVLSLISTQEGETTKLER